MKYLILLLAIAFAASPFLSSSFGGFAPDAFPVPQDDPPVQPAGYAFSIWGLIYLGLIAHAVIGIRRGDDPDWAPTRVPLAVSLAVGAAWIPVANASPIWATVLIWIMLAGSLAALLAAGRPKRSSYAARLALVAPLGLYAGWLTAASSVSIGLLLAGYGYTGELAAGFIGLAIAVGLGLAVLMRRPSPAYAAALVWALVGVVVANGISPVGLTALAAAVAVTAFTIVATRLDGARG